MNQPPMQFRETKRNFLEHFLREGDFISRIAEDDAYEIDVLENNDEYVVVDGEEGDFGNIRYYDSITKELLVTYVNEGGDSDDYEFTAAGVIVMRKLLMQAVERWLATFPTGQADASPSAT